MAKKVTIPAIGMPFGGGFVGADYMLNGERYVVIVAPKAEGKKMNLAYKLRNRGTSDGTLSDDDGFANSELINDDNHPAAQYCRSLRIGGVDDWQLPSRDDQMRIWLNLGPNRKYTPELFRAGGAEAFENCWYWTSTEHASLSTYAWMVNFVNG
ncbi:MAG: DUF1566 domain-containing protein, partial [Bacteroidetes bacterium]